MGDAGHRINLETRYISGCVTIKQKEILGQDINFTPKGSHAKYTNPLPLEPTFQTHIFTLLLDVFILILLSDIMDIWTIKTP